MSQILYETQKIVKTNNSEKIQITRIEDVAKLKQVQDIQDKVQEHFIVISLNNKNIVKSIELVGIGTVNCVPIDVSDVIRCAVIRGANNIIVSHNHPSGDNTPSKQDIYFTNRLNKACSLLNIKLLDHLVVGENILSMAKEGYIDCEMDLSELEDKAMKEMKNENIKLYRKITKLEEDVKNRNKESIKQKIHKAKERAENQTTKKINKQEKFLEHSVEL